MFKDVQTIAVYTADLKRAKAFYTDVLGFEITSELGEDLCFLRSRSGTLHVYMEGGREPAPVGPRTARLGFFLEAEESARETFERLRDRGVTMLHEAPEEVGDDLACFQFIDPDGNILDVAGKA
ncbi:MAG: VOC family protein [Planctomycetota bacterium]|jgi:catechol 2,3-dioxygenase-like lactoylglutathione lyase family enzyme